MELDFMSGKAPDKATAEELMEGLKRTVNCRDQMGGALYWNVLNDQACQIGNLIIGKDASLRSQVAEVIGQGNFF